MTDRMPMDDAVNQDQNGILKQIECFALDMDGTIYLGGEWIDGAKEFLLRLKETGRQFFFLTNNSSKSPSIYVQRLRSMGFEAEEDSIITSGQATIYYLQKYYKGKKVFLLGNEILKKEFEESGIVLEEENPELVVTGFDTSLDYAKMCKVCDLVRKGLPYIATHPDYNCPTENGFIPDIGAIHAFIHASAFRYPDRIIGKPNADMIEYLMSRINGNGETNNLAAGKTYVRREQIAMVGDRLYTDIAAGVNNGLKSVLVLSGEASLADAAVSEVKPDLIFDSVKQMTEYLDQED